MTQAPDHDAPVLELDGLTVKLGRRTILDQLEASFSGRAIGLLGPNGAGKTTLLRTLLGFYPPSAGGAKVFGRELATEGKQIRAEIGYMPESDAYISNITAIHFVRLMAELSGLPSEAALERGDTFLFLRVEKLGGEEIPSDAWREIAAKAESLGKFYDAFRGYDRAGDAEKAEAIRAEHMPDYTPFRPDGK